MGEQKYAAQAKYHKKIKQYSVKFNLSNNDKSIVDFLENEMTEKGMTVNAYLKEILTDYVNKKYQQ